MMMEEFIPFSEIDIDRPEPGWIGKISYTVEVMGVDKEGIRVMKHGKYEVEKPFTDTSLEEMRNRIGSVEDEEEPFDKRNQKE